ncbi:hypothetical protein Tco_0579282, partial [Tanacetum coccineum]
DKENTSKNSLVLRLKESKSGPLNKHAEERENLHAVISIPRAFQEDVASPVALARARSRGRTAILGEVDSEHVLLDAHQRRSQYIAWELDGSKCRKARSSVQDDLDMVGPDARIRQKAKRVLKEVLYQSIKVNLSSSAKRFA